MASTYLSKTFGSAGNRKKFTISTWVKRSGLGSVQQIMACGVYASTQLDQLYFDGDDTLKFDNINTGGTSTSNFISSQKFRDTSAWLHIVIKVDSTQATAGDRVTLYVNGSEISLATENQPAQNFDFAFNNNVLHNIGNRPSQTHYFDGSMTHFHFTDGYAYDASTFGETDSTSGIWKPKTSPSVTYGSNGFFLKFENSGAMGTDSSGNSNTFTVSGNLTQNVDSASNNFATGNPLIPNGDSYSNGNNTHTTSSNNYRSLYSTLGASSGKYYAECKMTDVSGGNGFGIANQESGVGLLKISANKYLGQDTNDVGYFQGGSLYRNGSVEATYGTISANDIVQIALDADNGYVYWGINGTWQNSGDPTSGSSGTGGYALSNIGSNGTYFIGTSQAQPSTSQLNFGNGYFGTTAVASAGTSPSGGGIFEYDCPSGYQALCTKGINSF